MTQPAKPLSPDDSAERTRRIRERYRQFVSARLGGGGPSWPRVVIGLLMLFTLVLIPVGVILIIKGLFARSGSRETLEKELAFIDQAEAVMAYPLMINSMLRSPGEKPAPGLVITTFEHGETDRVSFMADVALAALDPIGKGLPEPHEAFLVELMLDEDYQRSRRRKLPLSITGGRIIYACDLFVHPLYLPDRHLSDEMPVIPCLAQPGDVGEIRAMPYWCAFDVAAPEWANRTPVVLL
jgi:hypothetical protein